METSIFSFYIIFLEKTYPTKLIHLYCEHSLEPVSDKLEFTDEHFIEFIQRLSFLERISFQERFGNNFRELNDKLSRQTLVSDTLNTLNEIYNKINESGFLQNELEFIIQDLEEVIEYIKKYGLLNDEIKTDLVSKKINESKKIQLNIEASGLAFLFYELAFNNTLNEGDTIISAQPHEISEALRNMFCNKEGKSFSKDAFYRYLIPHDNEGRRAGSRFKLYISKDK
jgi:hypothetical protein